MPLSAGTFKRMADKLVTKDFGAFQKPLVIKTADPVSYGSDQTYSEESGTAIEISISEKQFSGKLIEIGDIRVVTNANQWTSIPTVDDTSVNFDNNEYNVLLVKKDADNAAYFITMRRK